MKKLFLILMSFLCSSHQIFTMYNPLFAAAIMKGRVAAIGAYVGSKVGLISQDDSRPTMWLHEDDILRCTWLYKESLANIYRKQSGSFAKIQKKEPEVEADILSLYVQKKLEKIAQLRNQLESFSKIMGVHNKEDVERSSLQVHVDAISTFLDNALENITQFDELQNKNLTNELLLKDISIDQDFLLWFYAQKNHSDLLFDVRKERDMTLRDLSSLIIDDKNLQLLEARIQELLDAPKLDFSTHVALARQNHRKEFHLYLTALGTYTTDLCACKNAKDYITIGVGGLGFLGFMSLMSKNNSELSKLVYVGCGGATSLVAKKLYYQFISEQQANTGVDFMQTNLGLAHSRLENLRRNMNDTISRLCSDLNKEFRDYKQDARCVRIEHGVDRANEGVSNLQAGQAVLQSTVTEGFDRLERNQQEQSNQTELLQQAMIELKDQLGNLSGDLEKTNVLLSNLSSKFDVSEEKIRAWLNAESDARNQFEAKILKKFSSSDQVQSQLLHNSQELLRLAQNSSQSMIQHVDHSKVSIADVAKIEPK